MLGTESRNVEDAVQRIEQLILSHCGEDAFDEVSKLLLAKLYDESEVPEAGHQFRPHVTASQTAAAIQKLFQKAAAKYSDLYERGETLRLPSNVLHDVSEMLGAFTLRGSALPILDATLEHLLSRAAKGAMGQYFTPRNVVAMCVEALSPKEGDIVLDPACGSGGFLISAIEHIQENGGKHVNAVGFDFDKKSFRTARIMSIAAGNGNITLSRRNSLDPNGLDLDNDHTFEKKYGKIKDFSADIILTNPPFGGDVSDNSILRHYASCDRKHATKMPRELLFIERCVQLLKPGGRAAIVIPQGTLANGSLEFFRDWLHRQCDVVGVVGLHPYAFLPHTAVKASVLFLVRNDKAKSPLLPTFFSVSSVPGKDSSGKFKNGDGARTFGNGDDLKDVARNFRAFASSRENGGRKILHEGCVNGQFSTVPLKDVLQARRLDAEYYDPEVLHILAALEQSGASSIRSLVRSNVSNWKRRTTGEIRYIDISSVDNSTGEANPSEVDCAEAPSRASYLVSRGDVLVSTVRPDRNTVGLIFDQLGSDLVASNGFCVLRPMTVSPEVLFAYCKTSVFRKLLSRAATATMYPAVGEQDVLDVPIPLIDSKSAEEIVKTIRAAQDALQRGRYLLRKGIEKMEACVKSQISESK